MKLESTRVEGAEKKVEEEKEEEERGLRRRKRGVCPVGALWILRWHGEL